jgi:hypothetical protein
METQETEGNSVEQFRSEEYRVAFGAVVADEADIFDQYVDGPENRQTQLDLYADTDNGKTFDDLPEGVRTAIAKTVDEYAQETRQLIDGARKFAEGDTSDEAKIAARGLATRTFEFRKRTFQEAKARLNSSDVNTFSQEDKQAMMENSHSAARQAAKALLYTK